MNLLGQMLITIRAGAIKSPGREEVRLTGREVYVHYPDGMGRSKLELTSLGVATARNINTVAKLVAMARE